MALLCISPPLVAPQLVGEQLRAQLHGRAGWALPLHPLLAPCFLPGLPSLPMNIYAATSLFFGTRASSLTLSLWQGQCFHGVCSLMWLQVLAGALGSLTTAINTRGISSIAQQSFLWNPVTTLWRWLSQHLNHSLFCNKGSEISSANTPTKETFKNLDS